MAIEAIVKMHNNLAEARYQLGTVEQKIFIYAITQIDQTKKEFNEVELVLSDLAEKADINLDSLLDTKNLDRYTDSIMKTIIKIWGVNADGRDYFEKYNLTSKVKHIVGTGMIKFKFNKDMMPLLLDLQKNFFIQAPEVITFSSSHSIRIYDYFKAKAYNENEWNTTIEDFKLQFGLEKKYAKWQDLKKWVIEPALKEIAKSDLQIGYKMRKRGRGAYYLDFKFETLSGQSKKDFENGSTKFKFVVDEIREQLKDAVSEFSDGQVYEFYCLALIHEPIHQDAVNFISRTIDYMNTRTKPIRNKYSYLKNSIEEGYVYGQMRLEI